MLNQINLIMYTAKFETFFKSNFKKLVRVLIHQISLMPETSLKGDSTAGIFLRILPNFSKTPPDDCSRWLLLLTAWFQPKFYSVITLFFLLHFIFLLLIIAIMGVCWEAIKIFNKDFFSLLTIIYPKISMNVVKTISPRQ